MIEASCHCGAVRLEVPAAPTVRTECNCSICRRIGGLWSYYPPSEVRIAGTTVTYRWGDRMLDLHHCPICGCTTHWSPTDPAGERMGVNTRLMEPAAVASARIRRVDGAADTWDEIAEP